MDKVATISHAKVYNAKIHADMDNLISLTNLRILMESDELYADGYELATFLQERFERLLETPESSFNSERFMKRLILKEKLGTGGFATVHKATWLGIEVGVKTFHGSDNPYFTQEVSILERISHANIISLLFSGVNNGECSIVMELMDDDLSSLMKSRLRDDRTRSAPFCIFEAVDVMLQVAEGVKYLHGQKIVHRDLKSANVLVKRGKSRELGWIEFVQAKVADFGLSKTKERSRTFSQQTSNTGTTRWMAPEVIKSENDDCKVQK